MIRSRASLHYAAGISLALSFLIAGLVLYGWLLIILLRQGGRRHLPWFVTYVFWGVVLQATQTGAWLIDPRMYVAVYWWMEAIAVVLIVGAVRESFLRIFSGFTKMPWFRWTVSGLIAAVIVYSAWKAIYAPPVLPIGRFGNFVIGAEFLFRWGITGIGLLTMVLSAILSEPWNARENLVVTGFMIASLAVVAHTVIDSLFGTKYLFVSNYLPSVGYFIALLLWIWAFSRPVQEFGFKELGIEPEDMLKAMRRYRETLKGMRWK